MKNSKRQLILAALLSNPTIREAAESSGIPEQTIYGWLRKPDFKAEYNERKRELVGATTDFLQLRLSEAAQVIFDIMNGRDTLPQTRLNAAKTVFEYCLKLQEQQEIIERIAALEGVINSSKR